MNHSEPENPHLPAERQTQLPVDQPNNFLVVIAAAASDPRCDVAKMQALLAMQERIEDRQAKGRFDEAFQLARLEMPDIIKKSKNPSTGSAYVKMEHVQHLIDPVLRKHGFAYSYGTDKSDLPNHYGVTCELMHMVVVNGKPISFSKHYRCDVPTDTHGQKGSQNKSVTHGMGSAMSYGQRYLLKLIFGLKFVGEDDDGGAASRGITPDNPPVTTPVVQYDNQANKRKMIDLTRHIHGLKIGYKEATAGSDYMKKLDQYLIDEVLISDTQTWTEFTDKPLADLIVKLEAKLKLRGA